MTFPPGGAPLALLAESDGLPHPQGFGFDAFSLVATRFSIETSPRWQVRDESQKTELTNRRDDQHSTYGGLTVH